MINSRKIEDLHPRVADLARKLVEACETNGIDLLITSTYRDHASQASLFAQGRTTPGKIVTNAGPGKSFHNWRVAFDVVPIVGGKAIWNDNKMWKTIGKLGVDLGLEWAGNWKTFKEMPHFQFTNGLTIRDFENGRTL
jgi:peptidoglycan L-alanyl-D-glutamate endopeptidase CwlK